MVGIVHIERESAENFEVSLNHVNLETSYNSGNAGFGGE